MIYVFPLYRMRRLSERELGQVRERGNLIVINGIRDSFAVHTGWADVIMIWWLPFKE